jgi:putative transposase
MSDQPAGDDCDHRGVRTDIPNPKHLAAGYEVAAVGTGKSRRRRITQQGQARRKLAVAHGKMARARRDYHKGSFGVGSRQPSDIRRNLHIVGIVKSPSRPGHQRRGMGASSCGSSARKPNYRRTFCSVSLVGFQQDMLDVHTLPRRTSARGTAVDVSGVPDGPRSRLQRRQSHSRRRAGGEIKRLPRKWARPRQRFRWSPGKYSHHTGGTWR